MRSVCHLAAILVLAVVMAGCSDSSTAPNGGDAPTPGERLYTVRAADIRAIDYFPEVTPLIQHDVTVYRLDYPTTINGVSLTVSSVIAIPEGLDAPAIIVDCHGTIQSDGDAPSRSSAQKPLRFVQMAAAGYIVFAPDYVGFGASGDSFHPWLLAEPGAHTVIDMIRNGQTALEESGIASADGLFLTGFSEGSNFVLAAQREIESHPEFGITLTAAAPSSGAYDMHDTFTRRLEGSAPAEAVGVVYLLLAMRDHYGWSDPLTDYLRQPYAGDLAALANLEGVFEDNFFNVSNPLLIEFVNGTLRHDSLFTPAFRDDTLSSPRMRFDAALMANDVYAWRPITPTTLFYGMDDTTTYFQNSLTAYDAFLANGADPGTITIEGFPGRDHESTESPSMRAALDFFATFAPLTASPLRCVAALRPSIAEE